jgi:hypothetical protein
MVAALEDWVIKGRRQAAPSSSGPDDVEAVHQRELNKPSFVDE